MLSFCPIGPISTLEGHVSKFHTHMALAHLVEGNKEYRAFYKARTEAGDVVLIDNGCFENGTPFIGERLLAAAHAIKATVVVAPDFPGQDYHKTIDAFNEYEHDLHHGGFKVMFCPQSEVGDVKGYCRCFEWGLGNPKCDLLGFSIIAIPNALSSVARTQSRPRIAAILRERLKDQAGYETGCKKPIHMLGMLAGLDEIRAIVAENQDFLNLISFDSSSPIWQGIRGRTYAEDGSIVKDTTAVDFSYRVTPNDLGVIDENLSHFMDYRRRAQL